MSTGTRGVDPARRGNLPLADGKVADADPGGRHGGDAAGEKIIGDGVYNGQDDACCLLATQAFDPQVNHRRSCRPRKRKQGREVGIQCDDDPRLLARQGQYAIICQAA